jgi:hypothetical protein
MPGELYVILLKALRHDTLYMPELLCPIPVMQPGYPFHHHDSWLLYSLNTRFQESCLQDNHGRLKLCHIHLSYHQDAVQDMLFPLPRHHDNRYMLHHLL